jgi:hypothetical protein
MKHLGEFGIEGCYVRKSNIIGFSAQKWVVDDALEPRETMFFFYNPTRAKPDQWAARGWHQVTGVYGCPCFKPNERWVFISDPGEVYVLGKGDDGDEEPIDKSSKKYFSAVKCISGGYAYAVGGGRKVYKRIKQNTWKQLNTKSMASPKAKSFDEIGFSDIDGFSDNEIYACGGIGDLWKYNGKTWKSVDVPTNVNLEKICCASNGTVYITTNANLLLIGRGSEWKVKEQNVSDYILEEIVCYKNKILVSSHEKIFELKKDKLVEADLSLPVMDSYAHMATGDEILVVAGIHSAYLYDGKDWNKIFDLV